MCANYCIMMTIFARISNKSHSQSSQNFLYMSPVAISQPSSVNSAITIKGHKNPNFWGLPEWEFYRIFSWFDVPTFQLRKNPKISMQKNRCQKIICRKQATVEWKMAVQAGQIRWRQLTCGQRSSRIFRSEHQTATLSWQMPSSLVVRWTAGVDRGSPAPPRQVT